MGSPGPRGSIRQAYQPAEITQRPELPLPQPSAWFQLPQQSHGAQVPSATFTPSAAGLRANDTWQSMPQALQDMITNVYTQGLSMGAQQRPATQSRPVRRDLWSVPLDSSFPQESEMDEGEVDTDNECELSEDEGPPPERPISAMLFKPALYDIMLRKAKQVTTVTPASKPAEAAVGLQPAERLFTEPQPESYHIPSSKIFMDSVKRPWQNPAAAQGPSMMDRKFYTFDPGIENLLTFPTIDEPVASLVSNAVVPSELAEGLKPEDRRAETLIRKTHQMASWAFRATSAASYFNRACILWLQEMQTRVGPEDGRLRQDLSKLILASEFSADATLNASKFASRAMATTLASRRLLWLRSWQVDAKSKWRLASAPFHGSELFGQSLDKVLIEDKEKRKVLLKSAKRTEWRQTPFFRRQPFRQEPATAGTQTARPYSTGYTQNTFRSDRGGYGGRGRQYQNSRKPYRNTNQKGFRGHK
ncbi:uncharacterized protein [Erythrolamprus reginae]|uniref:uncharacterized protein n=1 Tax=Erythrolamprus reginae TaxID=121349 RepID=UPI00396C873F